MPVRETSIAISAIQVDVADGDRRCRSPIWYWKVIARERADGGAEHAARDDHERSRPARADGLDRRHEADDAGPTMSADEQPDHERRGGRIEVREHVAGDGGVQLVDRATGRTRSERTTATSTPSAKARASRSPAMPDGQQHARDGDADEEQDPVQDAPAHRAEEPLAEEERRPDHEQVDRRRGRGRSPPPIRRRDTGDLERRSPSLRPWRARRARGPADTRRRGRPRSAFEARRPVSWGRGSRVVQRWPPGTGGGRALDRLALGARMIPAGCCHPVTVLRRRHRTAVTLARVSERRLLTAELLSIGSELTVGDTRDTNAGELARSLTAAGVAVGRLTALPDRLDASRTPSRPVSSAPTSSSRPAAWVRRRTT